MQPHAIDIAPPIELWLGPAGAGKTEMVLRRLCGNLDDCLLIVTSAAQAESLSQAAATLSGIPLEEIRARILPFHALVSELSLGRRGPKRTSIGRGFQRMILAAITPTVISCDDFLGKMLSAPGFVSAFQERLREWKLAGVTPADFRAAADAAKGAQDLQLARKLSDIERLFAGYEAFLRDGLLQDEEDDLTQATDLLLSGDAGTPRGAILILVHGFYRFTRGQRNLLRALAHRGHEAAGQGVEIVVTLPWEERRPLLFAAPGRTLANLRAEFKTNEILVGQGDTMRVGGAYPLRRLSTCLFGAGDPASDNTSDNTLPSQISGRPVRIMEAPNVYVEAEMVAREFRRLHDSRAISWSEFGVILRSTGDYAPILSAVFERYGVPLAADGVENCAQNPLLKTVLILLDVVQYGWRRDDVLAFLNSSYTAPDRLSVDLLRKYAWAGALRDGRERWLSLVEVTSTARRGGVPAVPVSIEKTLREMARIDAALGKTPADTRDFTRIVREIVSAFELEARIHLGDRKRIERDRASLKEGLRTLDSLDRMAALRSSGTVSLEEFHRALSDAWENSNAFPEIEDEHVWIMEPHTARERPIRVAAVMGLTERVFPRRIIEDAFVRDEERRLLRDWVGIDLEEQKLRVDDERFLFYLAVTAPTEQLLLSFPRSFHESDTLPSFFLDEVQAVFHDLPSLEMATGEHGSRVSGPGSEDHASGIEVIVRTLADVAPRADETAMPSDDLLAACADLFEPQGENRAREDITHDALRRIRSLLNVENYDSVVRAVLASRNLPHLHVLEEPRLRARFIGEKSIYTVPELESYARCPFQYLLRHVWKLKPQTDGLPHGVQSALLHTVLRRYFRSRAKRPEPAVQAGEAANVSEELQQILSECLQEASLNASPHSIRILRRRLNDDLTGFAAREARFSEQFGVTPVHFHLSFGRAPIAVQPDSLSCRDPLILRGAENATVAVSGVIDRVDVDGVGRGALVVEYEVGRPPEFAAIQCGESLQMPIYMLAIERLFGMAAAGACYDSMQETGRRRFYRTEHVNLRKFAPVVPFDAPGSVKPLSRDQFHDLVVAAQSAAVRTARAIAEGRTDATPGSHCRTCDFRDVCRTSQVEGHDGERRRS